MNAGSVCGGSSDTPAETQHEAKRDGTQVVSRLKGEVCRNLTLQHVRCSPHLLTGAGGAGRASGAGATYT